MEYETIGHLRKYFEDVERRYEDGSLIPTTPFGLADRDRMLNAMADLASLIVSEHHKAKGGDIYAAAGLLDLVDLRTKLALLLGKFEGFRYGQSYVVARAGSYSEYLI